jgi:cytochrome c551/c552
MSRRSNLILAGIILLAAIALLFGNTLYQRVASRPTDQGVQPVLVSATPSLPPAISVTPGADEALALTSGCLECHGVDQRIIGPSFHDVAARYKGDAGARNALIEIVKNGGKGNWTAISAGVPMPPYSPSLTDAEIEQLVDWVLGR